MLRKHFLVGLSFFVLAVCAVFSGADEIESLIETRQMEVRSWLDEEGELPPTLLFGNRTGIEIYNESAYGGKPSLLCDALPLVEMMELSGIKPKVKKAYLNVSKDQVRTEITQACLVRPGDEFLAVGRGTQTRVTAGAFYVQKARQVCPQDSPYTLWMELKSPLKEKPLFFSSNMDLPEGDNHFQSVPDLSARSLSPVQRIRLEEGIEFFEDYKISGVDIPFPNLEAVFHFSRRKVTLDDAGLPHEMVVGISSHSIHILGTEGVDPQAGSGQIALEAILDFDLDGRIDVWLKGVEKGCIYYELQHATDDGFVPMALPNPPCQC